MSYLTLRFDAAAGDAEAWSDALVDAGALSVDLSDPAAGTASETPLFGEPGSPAVPEWPVSRIVALLRAEDDPLALLNSVARSLDLPLPEHEVDALPEQDWVRQTQAQFGPIEIENQFWIVPTWSEVPAGATTVLRLDPGLAFGTGSHPTTRLCLEWLGQHVDGGESVLDYGCGSGILAIAARLLGAGVTRGVDVDPQAIAASITNATLNEVECTFGLAGEVAPDASAIVVANILANPLIVLAPLLAGCVAGGGRVALSGILDSQADAVVAAYAGWFTLAPWRRRDGWVLLAGERLHQTLAETHAQSARHL